MRPWWQITGSQFLAVICKNAQIQVRHVPPQMHLQNGFAFFRKWQVLLKVFEVIECHSIPSLQNIFSGKKEFCMLQIFVAVIDAFYLSFLSRPTSMCNAPPTINIMPGTHHLANKSLLQICTAHLITASSASQSCWSIFLEVPSFFRAFFYLKCN